MRFPAPDVGVARFPGPDIRAARFPGIDEAAVAFPPVPKLVVRVATETVIDISSTGVVIGRPWHLAETVIDVISAPTVSVSVTVDTESVVDVVSETIQIIDVVNSETIVDIVSGTTVKPSPTVSTNTVVDIASTSSVTPSPTINTETIVAIVSSAVVFPSPTAAGETIVDITSTSTVLPSPTVNTNTIVDILSEGVISTFKPSGMTKNGDMVGQTGSSAYRKIVGWIANTANYPGSSVATDGLVAQSTKPGATITVALDAGSSWNNLTARLRISVNGTVVVTGPDSTYTTSGGWNTPLSATATVNIVAGDVVTVEMSASPSGNYLTARGGAGTYVRIT
ncbi:hypothetical protein R3Q06_17635 [Rhodococcus erythropolis]|uniref:hypothetical protein n=1 Tax=Rhodococcus erythropolis TaxID=1833 RepID=UPI0029498D77|nr:hypothetical protein [Rhodococcus erythropolis]MDV6275321.1 hypothetical protein [Rhodococcus erythropolis]